MAKSSDRIKSDNVAAFEKELEIARRKNVNGKPFKLGPLKRKSAYGVFLWWAGEGNSWIHPDDVETAHELIPSTRVFCRQPLNNEYSLFSYGELQLRLQPILWREIKPEGFEVGDMVEVKSDHGKRIPFIGTIVEIRWDNRRQKIHYQIAKAGIVEPYKFSIDEFKPTLRLDDFYDERTLKLAEQHRIA